MQRAQPISLSESRKGHTHTHTLGTQAGCTPKVVLEAGKGCRLRIGSQNQQAVKDGYSRKGWEIKAISLVLQPPTE